MEQTEEQRQKTFQAAGLTPEQQAAVVAGQPTLTPPPTPTTVVNRGNQPQAQNAPPTQGTTPQANPLQMPASGSVVDILNAAGQSSDYASRQELAKQYGIQGYAGTAAQNTELGKKFLDFYNSKKGSAAPDSGAQARSDIQSFQEGSGTKQNSEQLFYDAYGSMNPMVKTLYDTMNQMLSSTGTKQTFREEFDKMRTEQGIEGLSTELMNIKRVMDGTEDDIRDEITRAGGFATESQVQALTGARNKTLLKQAKSLQDQLEIKNDYVEQVMKLSGMDREQVEKDVDRKLGLAEKMIDLQGKMDTAARTNYNNIVTQVGYEGLAKGLQGNPRLQNQVEGLLGLSKGSLTQGSDLLRTQSLKDKGLQFVSGTENQVSGVFDPNTGTFKPLGGGGKPGVAGVSSQITRDADSVMAGNLNLQDISTKNNYRASVASEINKRAEMALRTGDIYGIMAASAAYDKEPSDTFTTSMEKLGTVLGQIGVLQENISQGAYYDENGKKHTFNTGPIEGAFRGLNPWDTKAQTIKAQLNAIVPNLARGIYGEVGVLTDNDIKNYAKTLPNLKSTEDIRNAVLYITVDMIKKNAEIKIKNQAAAQRDMSGYKDYYKEIVNASNEILTKLPGSSRPGGTNTDNMVEGIGPDGKFYSVPVENLENFIQAGGKRR